tara:strand:- start:1581 stop:2591 length:1011 start_codon:yes stop_codon:yes gene_type:complete
MSATAPNKAEGTRRPLERVLRIHEMVSRKNFPNCSDIASALEVNRKTIQRDINFMRDELDLPLVYHDKNHGYAYSRPVNEFPILKTSAEDLVALILARNALEPMRGSSLEATLRSGFQRLQSSMSEQITIPWSEIDQAFSVQSQGLTEHDVFVFNRLAKAVLECRELHFDYSKLRDPRPVPRRLQPYHLVEIDGGWYVIGYDLDREARRTFAVQRMGSVQLTQRLFVRSKDFRLEDHFAGSFGVWANEDGKGSAYSIRILFRGFAARIVGERRWHPSQEITLIEADGSVIELSMDLTVLEDIARWVMGFGAQAEALEPSELRDMVALQLKQAAAQY